MVLRTDKVEIGNFGFGEILQKKEWNRDAKNLFICAVGGFVGRSS